MVEAEDVYLGKAEESLAGATSEYANHRYNNCANRCYYSCFQAAISALLDANLAPSGASTLWSHTYVQGAFAGELISRRKVYSADLRDALPRLYLLREAADYKQDLVSEIQAARALQRARAFLRAIRNGGQA